MNIHQIAFRFLPQEDRLLLMLNTHDKQELAFLITRRYLKLLWPALTKSLKAAPDIKNQASPAAQKAMLDFKNENIMAGAEKQKTFERAEKPEQKPFGDAPLLLSTIQVKKNPKNDISMLCLYAKDGKGLDIEFNSHLLHYFYNALQNVIGQTGWDLQLSPPDNQPHGIAH